MSNQSRTVKPRPPIAFKTSAVERFMRYVTFDTEADESSTTSPSSAKQWDLLRALADDLRELGCAEVELLEHGYVFATIPASPGLEHVPTIGFIAHVDTSPEMSGANVKPILHPNYQGQDIVLPDDPTAVLRPPEHPYLLEHLGCDIITASGLSLLGADNKAGVAEIVGAAEYLLANPQVRHGRIRIAFTPDEEIGRGADHFDVARFGAYCAYTMDGSRNGELEIESFSADAMTVTFQGFNCHPGWAKDRMINSIKIAADFIHRLPRHSDSPETTEDFEGYVHPNAMEASVDRTTVRFLIRDFVTANLAVREQALRELAEQTVRDYPGATVTTKVTETYRNMREVLDHTPDVVENAREALRRAGFEPTGQAIRGGTDGSRLSFMGLPTPNIFAGEQAIHSRLEWVSTYDIHKAVEVIVHLARIFVERA
jgi:tripeptide aminopeptidase